MAKRFQIQYDALTDEIETAYKAFQTKFALKKKLLYTIVYLIVIVLGVDLIIRNPSGPAGYIATGLAAGILIFNWIKPILIRRKLVETLSGLNDETYTATFYDDRIEIETVIDTSAPTETVAITNSGVYTVEEGSEAEKELAALPPEQQPKEPEAPPKTVYALAETDISFMEKDNIMMMFVNRSYIHTIPTRCLSDEQAQEIREYFKEKAII